MSANGGSKPPKVGHWGSTIDRDHEPAGGSQTRAKLRPGVSQERAATLKERFSADFPSDLEGRFGPGWGIVEIFLGTCKNLGTIRVAPAKCRQGESEGCHRHASGRRTARTLKLIPFDSSPRHLLPYP